MNNRQLPIILTALLLVFALAACGGDKTTEAPSSSQATSAETQAPPAQAATSIPEPTDTPTPEPPTPTPKPTNTPTPTAEPIQELAGTFKKIEDMVNSYRSKGKINYLISGLSEEENVNFTMEFTSEWVKADNPAGYNIAMNMSISGVTAADSEDAQPTPENLQMLMIDDTAYLKFGEQWITTAREEMDNPGALAINSEDFISGMENLKRVGEEEVNGMKAIHYTFSDIANYDEILKDILQQQLKDNNVSAVPTEAKVQGDLWVAKDGGYPVKSEMTMFMTVEITEPTADSQKETLPVEFHFEIYNEVYDVNSDIVIEPPEGAPQAGEVSVPGFEPGTFPIPEETEIEGSFGGITSLVSKLSADEVNAFYDQALPELGWSKADGFMPTWTKGDFSFNLMVTPNDDGTTNILIMTQPQQ